MTVLGFYYAIVQIRKTKSAAIAAEEAATNAVEENRKSFHKYVALCAHGYVTEIKLHIENRDWAKAAMRTTHLADQMVHIAASMVAELRKRVDDFHRLEKGTEESFEDKLGEVSQRS